MELGAEMKRLAALGCRPAGNQVISLPETEPRSIEHTILFKREKKKKNLCKEQVKANKQHMEQKLEGWVAVLSHPGPGLLELKKLSYV